MSLMFDKLANSSEEKSTKNKQASVVQLPQSQPRNSSFGSAIGVFVLVLALIALGAASGYLFQTLQNETRERKNLEASYIQLSDKIKALGEDATQLRGSLKTVNQQIKIMGDEVIQQGRNVEQYNIKLVTLETKLEESAIKESEAKAQMQQLATQMGMYQMARGETPNTYPESRR